MGLSEDRGRPIASIASIAAHEMGHIFRMNHDDGRECFLRVCHVFVVHWEATLIGT